MMSKEKIMEVLAGFDVRDLNQVMELLEGLKSVRESGKNIEWWEIFKPINEVLYSSNKKTTTFQKDFNSESLEVCALMYIRGKNTDVIKDTQTVVQAIENNSEILKLEEMEVVDGRSYLKIRIRANKDQINKVGF